MSYPVFPNLPGQGWSIHKKPTFSTRVASHASGRDVRAGLYAHALYEFELGFDALDSSGQFGGLQMQSLQSLMGFFMAAHGQLYPFLYADPSDGAANAQIFGTGDGATKVFTLGRSLGAFFEPVSYVTAVAGVTVNGAAVSGFSWVAPNQLVFSNPPIAGAVLAWTGTYAFLCRFLDDTLDFEQFLAGVWRNKSIKFRSIR